MSEPEEKPELQKEAFPQPSLLQMTSNIVAAYVGKNSLPLQQLPELIETVYSSLIDVHGHSAHGMATRVQKPPVPIKKSVTDNYIICLEDGKKLKMLKRHLRSRYNMSPEEYRAKWGLPTDYPMVAPNYAVQRSEFAKKIGLGKDATGKTKGHKADAEV